MKNVALRSCQSYEYNQVNQQFEKLIQDIGGLHKYINKNSTVFIKLNLNPNKVPTVQRCIERNLIKEDFSDICILGDNIDDMVIKDFKIPKNKSISLLRGMIPKNLEVYINKKLAGKPVINYKKCVKCGKCSKVCPPGVISMECGFPSINLENCIRCFCCHELCPKKAVDIKRFFVFKFIK